MNVKYVQELLLKKGTSCTLRNQPHHLTQFFYDRLRDLSLLAAHPESACEPRKTLLLQIFDMLKLIASPVDNWRKDEKVAAQWPAIQKALDDLQ